MMKRVSRKQRESNHKNGVVVGELVKRNANFLHSIAESGRSAGKLRTRLASANTEQLLCFVEICLNILRNRLPLDRRQLARLRAHAQQIRALSRARSVQRTRQLLQSGSGVPAVAALVASVVLPLLTDYIKRQQQQQQTHTEKEATKTLAQQ